MSPESYYAGCYWGERAEPMKACAQHAALLFDGLRQLDPSFARWFEKAYSRKKALELQFEPSEDGFLKLLSRKQYQFAPSTFSFDSWNGLPEDESSGVSFFCGVTNSSLVGSCVVDLPYQESTVAQRILTTHQMAELLRLLAVAWAPEWGVATSLDLTELLKNENEEGFTGWITYFARGRGELPPLPAPCRVEPVGERGSLIVLTPERFTVSNPAHVELASEVQLRLRDAGLIRPRPRPVPPPA
ncbi:MAG TPA: immunity 52 family protein [Myxococcaceae bacterium]|nr:immunity 52 family protein [Myxococcaceae bacterium]